MTRFVCFNQDVKALVPFATLTPEYLTLNQGLFPPIHDRPVEAQVWQQDYIATYVERMFGRC